MKPKYEIIDNHKICNICGKSVHISGYDRSKQTISGIRGDCRQCKVDRTRAGVYSLSLPEYYKLIETTKCQICGSEPRKKRHSIDHDHSTGKVRGMLCTPCNQKLGWFENNSKEILTYLKETKNEST